MALNPSTALSGMIRPFKHLQGVHIKTTHMTAPQACWPLGGGWASCNMVPVLSTTFFLCTLCMYACAWQGLTYYQPLVPSARDFAKMQINHPEYTLAVVHQNSIQKCVLCLDVCGGYAEEFCLWGEQTTIDMCSDISMYIKKQGALPIRYSVI